MNDNKSQKKLDFLNQLLAKNPELQHQYDEFMKEDDPGPFREEEIESFIMNEAEELAKKLEALDISDPDWEHYTPRHSGYIEEWEARMHLAEDMVTEVLGEHEEALRAYFSEGKTDLALLCFAAGYDACLEANLEDEYDTLGDAQFFLTEEMQKMQDRVIQKLDSVVFPNRQAYTFFSTLFSHFKKHHHENETYLRFFEPLLLAVSGDKERAVYMNRLLNEKQIPRRYIPQVATELYKITENKEKWLEEAEYLVEVDVKVARDLLTEYSQTNYADFIRIAQKLWQAGNFKRDLAHLIFGNINKEKSPGFYKEVLLWLTSNGRAIAKYKLLRDILTEEEKEEFIQGHKKDHVFYTKMLEQEQRYDEILIFIKKNLNSWHLNKMLTTIIKPLPGESFDILEKKILTTLETERGRGVYRKIVEWLRLARRIKNMEEHTTNLIHQLYNWKPALPALKDELRKAGMRG